MKLWDKGYDINKEIEDFTVGRDREFDLYLATYDVQASMAHADMLCKIGMISSEEKDALQKELQLIETEITAGRFVIEANVEDVHSQIEKILVAKIGDIGKKIHLGRSRNDQVLVALRMFFRDRLQSLIAACKDVVGVLLDTAEKHKDVLIPGYTHMQIGMVSSCGLWLSAFAEGLIDDAEYISKTISIINRNPLGTAAGYGSSLPLDRQMTTDQLSFEGLCINPINAQLGRGKSELLVANGLSTMALTINKLAMDICLFSNENYGILSLPKEYTTGSSIMPHKKNPDVFELIRAKSNLVITLPNQVASIISNLTSGYHRDFQLQKEIIFPALDQMSTLLRLIAQCVPQLVFHESQVHDEKYQYLWSVELVNKYVQEGMTFRDAYRKVGMAIDTGDYHPPKQINHTHIGSIGNLGLDKMRARMRTL